MAPSLLLPIDLKNKFSVLHIEYMRLLLAEFRVKCKMGTFAVTVDGAKTTLLVTHFEC